MVRDDAEGVEAPSARGNSYVQQSLVSQTRREGQAVHSCGCRPEVERALGHPGVEYQSAQGDVASRIS